MATVLIPKVLQQYSSGRSELSLAGCSVREILNELRQEFPDVYRCVCDETDSVRPHINLFVNEDLLRDREGLKTQLTGNDVLSIFQAVSGG